MLSTREINNKNFSQKFLDDLCNRIALSDVIGDIVSFDRKKSNPRRADYWACCPFHQEKTPSFRCDDKKGRYYCFGCKETGNHITFLMRNQNMTFPAAVEFLAKKAGVALPIYDKAQDIVVKQSLELYDVMELACNYFIQMLFDEKGYYARQYLKVRGVSDDSIHKFRLGYALPDFTGLKD